MKNTLSAILLVLVLMTASGCSLIKSSTNNDTSVAINDFTNQDSKATMTQTKANLDKAKAAAVTWKTDALWVALNFNIPSDLKPQSLTQTFVFGSTDEANNWFTYSIDASGKFVRAVIPKSDFLGPDLSAVSEQYWKIGYVEALQTAYSNGGNAFLAQHPEAQITLTLSQSAPKNWLWYAITFQGANEAKKIRISANDGKVYNDQGILVQ